MNAHHSTTHDSITIVYLPPRPSISEWLRWVGQKQVEAALKAEKVTQEAAQAVGEGQTARN